MKSRTFLFTLLLAAALGSWWWVLQRTVSNERAAFTQRLQEEQQSRYERALENVRATLENDRLRAKDTIAPGSPVEIAEAFEVLKSTSIDTIDFDDETVERPAEVRALALSGADDEFLLKQILDDRIYPMKASFRSWAIGKLRERSNDEGLVKLQTSEVIRSLGVVPEGALVIENDHFRVIWTAETITELFAAEGSEVVLGPQGNNLSPLNSAIYARPAPVSLDDAAFQKSSTLIRWVGIGSGTLFLITLGAAFYLSYRSNCLAKLRMDLAASMAHELRTPLAGQQLMLESLAGALEQSPEERRRYAQNALSSNQRLSSLAEQFLTFSRLERGTLEISPVETNLSDLTDQFTEVDVEASGSAMIDPHIARTIIGNLVENAQKYGKPRISLVAYAEDGQAHFIVSDQGDGLTAAQKKKVFRPYWRADKSLARTSDGLGLGLSIVKRLAEAHGGTITVRDAQPTGAIFHAVLGAK